MLHALLPGAALVAAAAPDAALTAWVRSIPAVRCVPAAFGSWTNARANAGDASGVPVTPVGGARFARSGFAAVPKLTLVAGTGSGDRYYAGRVPSSGDAVLAFDGEGGEDTFTAVVAATSAPPRAVAALASTPRAAGIGLGSTRAAVEGVLGAGRAKAICGLGIVHYAQSPPAASVADLWVFYRDGVVVALARAEGA
jgi:hypothetical protein